MRCRLNVNDHEYDQILQWNHDAVVWNTADEVLMERLAMLVGADTTEDMKQYDECRMEKQETLTGSRLDPEPDVAIAAAPFE